MKIGDYVCFGGPLDMKVHVTDGIYQFYVNSIVPGSIKVSEQVSPEPMFGSDTMQTHTYRRKDFNLMGTKRTFYIHSSLSEHEAINRVGLFLASLVDLYVAS